MIVLDTNVISEMMRPIPQAEVSVWLSMQSFNEVFTTAVTKAEVLVGLRVMPAGRRRAALEAQADGMFSTDFAGRVLAFDTVAADIYADISAYRRSIGRPILVLDAQIAAIAISRGAALATRNVRDFQHLDLEIIDPWTFAA